MAYKKIKKTKKKEDLPSFLLHVPEVPQNVSFLPKTTKSVHRLGPIFFGCQEYQPMFHSLNLGLSYEIHKAASSTENILRDAFLPKSQTQNCVEVKKACYPSSRAQILFPDPYPHKCPGTRKIFVPESSFVINLGETKSIIEGEASQEIPVCCIWKTSVDASETEYEVIDLSDIWERKRIFMPYKERIAHAHFPKKFVTLEVIGPTIPAAITITKLPSKRRTESELELQTKVKTKKEAKADDVKTKKVTEVKAEVKESSITSENFPSTEEQIIDAGAEEKDESIEESDNQEQQSDQNKAEINEKTVTEEERNEREEEESEEKEEKEEEEREDEQEEMREEPDTEESENLNF